jgi:hypothetical protein
MHMVENNTTWVNMACFLQHAKQSFTFFNVKAQNLSQIWNSKDHICGHWKKAITLFGSRGIEVVVHH